MAKKKDETLELSEQQSEALDALAATQKAEAEAQAALNEAQYSNIGQIISDVEGKIATAKQKDEDTLRRENAYRYITGLGDTLSGVANLIGVANKASNQQQTYNSNAIVQKAEEQRKARKLEIDDLSNRLDEMNARQRELKAAGSLAEAQLKAKHDRELISEKNRIDRENREYQLKQKQLEIDATNAAANMTRANASETNAETKANKPATTGKKPNPKYIKMMDSEGKMYNFDTSSYKDFDKDYQKALAAAIADGTSGLSDDEIKEYKNAVEYAKADSGNSLKEFLRTHTYRKSIIDRMNGKGANNPKYQ